jgi:pyrroline-5-carboxylate reductase
MAIIDSIYVFNQDALSGGCAIVEHIVKKIGILGVGNMGTALIKGLIESGVTIPQMICAYDVDQRKIQELSATLGVIPATSPLEAIRDDTEVLLLAVKPQIIDSAIEAVSEKLSQEILIVSIAAGVSTHRILEAAGFQARVIRAMPNAPAMIQQGATAICKGGSADDNDLGAALELFSAIGQAVVVDEKLMNAVTGLSGSGPGYLFALMEAFTDGGVLMGLDRPTARKLTVQTFLGAAKMAMESGESFSDLKDKITSPGGTTIAGMAVLERAGARGIMMDAVRAATQRGFELEPK